MSDAHRYLKASANPEADWPLVRKWVGRCATLEINEQDMLAMCKSKRAHLVMIYDVIPVGAMVFEYIEYPRSKAVHVLALGGRGVASMNELWIEMKQAFAGQGVAFIQAFCKEPQSRLFARLGFKKETNIVRVDL